MFKDQAWTVAFSLISSLVVAMLVIPMLVSTLFREKKRKYLFNSGSAYSTGMKKFLEKIIEKRGMVIVISVILMVGTGFLIPQTWK